MKLYQQRQAIALWNQGDYSALDISRRLDGRRQNVDAVLAFLASQPGFPDDIIGPLCSICRVRRVGGKGCRRYCSPRCAREARRRQWWAGRRPGRRPEEAPPRRRDREAPLSRSDERVMKKAKREANERGTTRDAVLAEWKFVPERSPRP